jgi:hypothetical protein
MLHLNLNSTKDRVRETKAIPIRMMMFIKTVSMPTSLVMILVKPLTVQY